MTEHVLKTLPAYWDALASGEKNFEVRRDDRGFQKGDVLVLLKYKGGYRDFYIAPDGSECYQRRAATLRFRVTYVLTGGQLGIEPGYVVMGLEGVATPPLHVQGPEGQEEVLTRRSLGV